MQAQKREHERALQSANKGKAVGRLAEVTLKGRSEMPPQLSAWECPGATAQSSQGDPDRRKLQVLQDTFIYFSVGHIYSPTHTPTQHSNPVLDFCLVYAGTNAFSHLYL